MPLNQPGRSGGILPYLFLYIPVVWAALLIAQSLGDGLPELLTNLTAALQTPLKIRWTEHSLMSILACTGAYIIWKSCVSVACDLSPSMTAWTVPEVTMILPLSATL